MDINYFMKIQNAYGTKTKRDKDLWKINYKMGKHFNDTYDTENVLLNGKPFELMIIKDTEGNTFKKKIKSKHDDMFNLGDYIIWNNQHWIVTLLDTDDKTWNRGYMYLCTVPLRWQNEDGKIIERYCYSEDFTKYSTGRTGNKNMYVGDNQYGLTIPIDSETKKLKRDMRFPIDFDDAFEPDVYALTNRKVKLNDDTYFGRGGTMILTLSFNAFSKERDKHVILDNGSQVWICDYHSPISDSLTEKKNQDSLIIGSSKLQLGIFKPYSINSSEPVTWNIKSNFEVISKISDSENKINLRVDNEEYINDVFVLQAISKGMIISEIEITVTEGF